MIVLVAFSVPLYNLFCRVTGYGGTTSFSENISTITLDQEIKIQFNADVNDSINWSFEAPQDVDFKIGENKLVEYQATNLSGETTSGTATFNVLPEKVGPYFIKTQCFCFEKQTLELKCLFFKTKTLCLYKIWSNFFRKNIKCRST